MIFDLQMVFDEKVSLLQVTGLASDWHMNIWPIQKDVRVGVISVWRSYRWVLGAAREGNATLFPARVPVSAVKVDVQVPVVCSKRPTALPLKPGGEEKLLEHLTVEILEMINTFWKVSDRKWMKRNGLRLVPFIKESNQIAASPHSN